MCYGNDRFPSREDLVEAAPPPENEDRAVVVENLRDRLAETEARLERARAREAELSRRLDEMKKFVRVMEILEIYLRRQYAEQQDRLKLLYSSPPPSSHSIGQKKAPGTLLLDSSALAASLSGTYSSATKLVDKHLFAMYESSKAKSIGHSPAV